jgi:hypothetical protein
MEVGSWKMKLLQNLKENIVITKDKLKKYGRN